MPSVILHVDENNLNNKPREHKDYKKMYISFSTIKYWKLFPYRSVKNYCLFSIHQFIEILGSLFGETAPHRSIVP